MVFSKEKRNKKVFIKNFKKKWSIIAPFFDGKKVFEKIVFVLRN